MTLFSRTAMIYGANMARAGLGFLMSVLVARFLGPEQFGVFALFITVMVLAHNLLGEGLDPGVVRYYASYVEHRPARANRVLQASLALRMGLAAPVVGLGWGAAPWIARNVFGDDTLALPLRLGLSGALTASLCTFTLAGLRARERFGVYAALAPLVNALRVAAVPLLLAMGLFTLPWVMGTQVALFLVGAAAGFWMLRDALADFRVDWPLMKELLHFSKWTALANLCFVLLSQLNVPVLNGLSGAREAGLFAAGATLLMVVDQITVAILTVRAPAVGRLADRAGYIGYIRQALPTAMFVALPLCLLVLVAQPLIQLVYGPDYEGSVTVVQILLAGFLATLISHPLYLVFYAMNRPERYAATALAALGMWSVAAWALIPTNGALGASVAVCSARLLQAALIGVLLWFSLRSNAQPAGARG